MNQLQDISLAPNQLEALSVLRQRLFAQFDLEAIVLYGSVARNEADEESDIDLLIITKKPFASRAERHQITDVICEINLEYDTNFSSLVVDRDNWETGMLSFLPIHQEILKDGIEI